MQKNKTSVPLQREDQTDLAFLRKLLVICQTSCGLRFWEVRVFFLLAKASLAASRTLLQQLLVCLNFNLDGETYSVGENKRNDLYGKWRQHKQLKIMEMNVAWLSIYNGGCMHQFQLDQLTTFRRSTKFEDTPPMEHIQMIAKTPN